MTTNIKQKVIRLLKHLEGDKAKPSKILTFLGRKDVIFPQGEEGVDKACFILANIFEKNSKLLDKATAEPEHFDYFTKTMGLDAENQPDQDPDQISPKLSGKTK